MDISAEIAAIQAASQGSELRQPLVGALNKLNSGSLPAVTVSDAGKILKVGANGWEVGEKSGYMPVPTATKQITENGTYDVTDFASAQVSVPSGSSVLVSKTITQNGTYDPVDDNADGYSEVIVNIPIGVPLPAAPLLPNEYQEVEYIVFDGASWLITGNPPKTNGILYIDAEQDDLSYASVICGYRDPSGSTSNLDWSVGRTSGGNRQQWYCRAGNTYLDFPDITPSGKRVTSNSLITLGTLGDLPRPFYIGNYYTNTASTAYCPMKGKIFSVKYLLPSTIQWGMYFIPCYRKSDNTVGMYDAVNSMFCTNVGSGTLVAGPNVI